MTPKPEPVSYDTCIEHAFQAYEHLAQLAVLLQHPAHPKMSSLDYDACVVAIQDARRTVSRIVAYLQA